MFEKTSQLAEKLATSVSRRHFLGSLGRWAGATALAMAGVLTTVGAARADNGYTCCTCCYILDGCFFNGCVKTGDPCPSCPTGAFLSTQAVTHCANCPGAPCKKPCGGA